MTRTNDSIEEKPLNQTYFEHPRHQTTLLEGLNSLREKGELLDIALLIEGRIFRAHRAVLAASSDYFRAMFTDNMLESRQDEIRLNGITAKGFQQLLDYAYTSKLTLNLANVQDVLEAASFVQMENVIQACSNYLLPQIDVENCVDIATIAETYSLTRLKVMVYRFMSEHLLEFSNSKEFYRLTGQQLEDLLVYDFPVDCSEGDVLRIVLTWFFHVDNSKSDVRLSHTRRLIRHIHFKEISRRKLDSILDKIFQHRHNEWELFTIIQSESYNQTNSLTSRSNTTLVNSRGMKLAILKIGGFGLSGITNEITYSFTSDGNWQYLTKIPHLEQCNFGTAIMNNELYIVGGCFNQSLQENIHPFGFKYNPRDDKWSTMAPMKLERCRFSLNVVGRMLFAVGGVSEIDEYDTSTCERYDPNYDIWTPIASLPTYLTQHAGASYENKLFISGGMDRDQVQSTMYCYNVNDDKWQICSPMLTARADHVMLTIGDFLYVCGGWTEYSDNNRIRILVDDIEVYDIKKDCWKYVTKIPFPRYHSGIVYFDHKIYFIGGFQDEELLNKTSTAVECYDLATGSWFLLDKYPQDIWEHTCVALYIPKWRNDMQDLPPFPS